MRFWSLPLVGVHVHMLHPLARRCASKTSQRTARPSVAQQKYHNTFLESIEHVDRNHRKHVEGNENWNTKFVWCRTETCRHRALPHQFPRFPPTSSQWHIGSLIPMLTTDIFKGAAWRSQRWNVDGSAAWGLDLENGSLSTCWTWELWDNSWKTHENPFGTGMQTSQPTWVKADGCFDYVINCYYVLKLWDLEFSATLAPTFRSSGQMMATEPRTQEVLGSFRVALACICFVSITDSIMTRNIPISWVILIFFDKDWCFSFRGAGSSWPFTVYPGLWNLPTFGGLLIQHQDHWSWFISHPSQSIQLIHANSSCFGG